MYPTNYVNNYEKGHIVSNKIITFGTKFATLMEKNLKVLTILSLFLMFGIFSANAQTYEQMWKSVEKYDNDDLPKQVISEAEKIFDKAEREHNYVQMLKSWKALVEKQSDIDPEVFTSLIEAAEGKEVQSDGDKSKAPKHTITKPKEGSADAAVYHAILGSAYDVMRTAGINDYDEDINERYTQLAEEHLEKALANKRVLADTPADDYYPLMEKGKDSYLYDNSMLQVIMDFAVETFFWDTNICQHLKECADLYKERGNLNAYALCMHQLIIRQIDNDDKEIRISRTEADRRIKSLFEEVKNEEVGCDIALFVYNSYNSDDEKLAFIRWALAQYPNHKLINEFKNEEAEILRATCTIKTDNHIIANQPFNVKAITTNMTELTIQVRQYDGRDKNNRLKETGAIVQEYKFPVAQDPVNSKRRAGRLTTTDTLDQKITLPAGNYVFISKGNGCSQVREMRITTMQLFTFELIDNQSLAAVVDNKTGRPITDATINLADNRDRNEITMSVDKRGEITFDSNKYKYVGATRTKDDVIERTYRSKYWYNYESDNSQTILKLFTDRSIYRPGHTVHLYGLAYNQDGDDIRVMPNFTTKVRFRDANYQTIAESEVRTNDHGSFDIDFVIPTDRMPGRFTFEAQNGSQNIQVEEYKRPTFQIDMHADSTANALQGNDRGYTFGDTLPVIVSAKTFSGVAVQGATVKYTIEQANSLYWYPIGSWEETESGELTTDDNGNVTIPLFLDGTKCREWEPDKYHSEGEARIIRNTVAYKVTAYVTDLAGETHSEEFYFRASGISFNLSIDTKGINSDSSSPNKFVIKAYDVTQHPIEAKGTYEIFLHDKVGKDPEVKDSFTAGQQITLPTLAPGSYVIKAYAYDKNQHKIEEEIAIDIYDTSKAVALGSKAPAVKTHFKETKLFCSSETFSPEKGTHIYYAPADEDVYVFYYILSNDKIIKSERLTLGRTIYDIPLKYNKEYGDGVEICFFYVKDGEVHYDRQYIQLEEPDKSLKLSWSTFRDKLQPGQQEEWVLTVKDKNGKAVSGAELLAAMYDSSLDDIQKHSWYFGLSFVRNINNHGWWDFDMPRLSYIMRASRQQLPTYDRTYNSLIKYTHERYMSRSAKRMVGFGSPMAMAVMNDSFEAHEVVAEDKIARPEEELEDEDLPFIGAGTAEEEIIPEDEPTQPNEKTDGTAMDAKVKLRTNFNETAFFMPHLTTDSEGNAHIAFTLPESLTEWKFMGLAHTDDMDYGSITEKIVAQKQFMVQPNMPRFVREGDHVSIVTRIINQSDKVQDGKAVIRIINPETDELVFSDTKPFTLETGKTASVGFEFDAPDQYPMLVCEITGVGSDYSDGERNYLPVLTSKRHLTETQPFYILPAEGADAKDNTVTVDLTSLFNHNSSTATQKRLSFEYTARPEWTVIEALEGISLPKDDNAISYAASLYANTVATRIANTVPGLKEAVAKGIERDNAKTSEISDDQELKDILLKESPWVLEAMGEADQRAAIIDLFNEHLMAGRLEKAKSKLISMQKGNGSWGWFDDMSGSYYVTLTVADNLARLGADNPMKAQLNRALNYLDAEELETYNYRKKHRLSMNPSNSTLQYMELYTMMPDRKPGKDVSKMIETYLSEVEKNVKDLTIYGRANASNILRYFGHTKSADKFMQSVIEYSTTKPGMGRYFATDNAYYSWLDYKIPTQIAAMKAIRDKHPELLPDMQLWLLRQKQTQTWDNPINTVEAIDFLNSNTAAISHPSLAVSPKVTFAGCKTEEYPVDTIKFLAEQLGYVKQVISPEVYADGLTTMEVKAQPQGLISWGAVYAQCLDGLDRIQASSSGELKVSRRIIEVDGNGNTRDKQEFHVGDKVTMRVSISADRDMDFVQVRCQHPACFEPTDQHSGFMWMGSRGGYMARHDASTDIFFDRFTKGTTTFDITFTITRTGIYQSGIATAQCAYAPEFSAHSAGSKIEVKKSFPQPLPRRGD